MSGLRNFIDPISVRAFAMSTVNTERLQNQQYYDRKITFGNGLMQSGTPSNVTLSATGTQSVSSSAGLGNTLIDPTGTATDIKLKRLVAGTNITLTPTDGDITITASGGGSSSIDGLTDASTTGGTGNIAIGVNYTFIDGEGVANNNIVLSRTFAPTNYLANNSVVISPNGTFTNFTGGGNVFVGYNAGVACTGGGNNTILGNNSAPALNNASGNTIVGTTNGTLLTIGNFNTVTGYNSLINLVSGAYNISSGYSAGNVLISGSYNVTIGFTSDSADPSTSNCVAIGNGAVAGNNCVAMGSSCVSFYDNSISIGSSNVTNSMQSFAIGSSVNIDVASSGAIGFGYQSVIIGENSIGIGSNIATDGNNSIALGNFAKTTAANQFCLPGSGLGTEIAAINQAGTGGDKGRMLVYNSETGQIGPLADATAGYVIKTDGNGLVSWTVNDLDGLADCASNSQCLLIGSANTVSFHPTAPPALENTIISRTYPNNAIIGGDNIILGNGSGHLIAYDETFGNGRGNIVVGNSTCTGTTNGEYNIIIGNGSGNDITTGSNNIILGTGSTIAVTTGGCVNNTCIGLQADVTGSNNNSMGCYITLQTTSFQSVYDNVAIGNTIVIRGDGNKVFGKSVTVNDGVNNAVCFSDTTVISGTGIYFDPLTVAPAFAPADADAKVGVFDAVTGQFGARTKLAAISDLVDPTNANFTDVIGAINSILAALRSIGAIN